MKQKLLVTGASGFLGWTLCQVAQPYWQIYGTYATHGAKIPGVSQVKADLQDLPSLRHLLTEIKPDAIIHLAALSRPNYCQTHPQESYNINVLGSCAIADYCATVKIPCVFTSTDLVFDGTNPPYRETSPPSPVSLYGEHKLLAEEGMLQRYPQTAICRMPLMFGEASPTSYSFLQPFLQQFREGQALRLFYDEYRMPVSATTAARGLLLALEKVQGYVHLGGKERLSRYEFGELMAEVFHLSREQITRCSQKDVPMAAPRPADLSMDSSLAFGLGYNPPSVKAALMELRGKV
ncbi:NAD(P)-dependent oxidoreductase [Spirulina sp. CS-785/01]|uniref:SDR family oxidoreductase n=1 Tax=Spirulina sp. CS-785/01 TaxID=3021716 RepID=UPI00232E2D6D|nr:NAD(P)-dependent oxidoreductase [Spirulina sp. CS-785/01]MDB9314815.1 NAD(P)-dependent oxidoreductase [Spirulina sp. CS-785/01]